MCPSQAAYATSPMTQQSGAQVAPYPVFKMNSAMRAGAPVNKPGGMQSPHNSSFRESAAPGAFSSSGSHGG